jgi:hypothetical protein
VPGGRAGGGMKVGEVGGVDFPARHQEERGGRGGGGAWHRSESGEGPWAGRTGGSDGLLFFSELRDKSETLTTHAHSSL